MILPMPDRMKINDSPRRPINKVKFCIVGSVWSLAACGGRGSVRRQRSAHARRQHALGEQVMVAPVIAAQFIQSHRAALVRRVHEAAMADVDRNMVDAMTVAEEQQVAGFQRAARNRGRIQRGDFARGARQGEAGFGPEDVIDQARAVEARVGRVPAPPVRRADQSDRAKQYIVGDRGRWHRHRRSGGRNGRAGPQPQQDRARREQATTMPWRVQRAPLARANAERKDGLRSGKSIGSTDGRSGASPTLTDGAGDVQRAADATRPFSRPRRDRPHGCWRAVAWRATVRTGPCVGGQLRRPQRAPSARPGSEPGSRGDRRGNRDRGWLRPALTAEWPASPRRERGASAGFRVRCNNRYRRWRSSGFPLCRNTQAGMMPTVTWCRKSVAVPSRAWGAAPRPGRAFPCPRAFATARRWRGAGSASAWFWRWRQRRYNRMNE